MDPGASHADPDREANAKAGFRIVVAYLLVCLATAIVVVSQLRQALEEPPPSEHPPLSALRRVDRGELLVAARRLMQNDAAHGFYGRGPRPTRADPLQWKRPAAGESYRPLGELPKVIRDMEPDEVQVGGRVRLRWDGGRTATGYCLTLLSESDPAADLQARGCGEMLCPGIWIP